MKMRGTSGLFRSDVSPLSQIKLRPVYGELVLRIANRNHNEMINSTNCAKCTSKKYTLAKHIVKTLADGTVVNPQLTYQMDVQNASKDQLGLSTEAFTATTPANVILDSIKAFANKYGFYARSSGNSSDSNTNDWHSLQTKV